MTVAAVAVAVALAVQGGGGDKGGSGATKGTALEILRQPADAPGPNPFTASVAADSLPADAPTPTASASPAQDTLGAPAVSGGTPGLYGGHRGVPSCDVGRLIANLTADSAKAKAFADVVGIEPGGIRGYVHTLTPVLLRADTRVTDHGYRSGSAVAFPAVLQAGTAVLAGPHGLPRLRCAGGNPLQPPPAADGPEKYTGSSWSSFDASRVIAVAPASERLKEFVLYDPKTHRLFVRPPGTNGGQDRARSAATTGPATPARTPTRTPAPAGSTPAEQSSAPAPSTSAGTTTSTSASTSASSSPAG